MAVIVLTSAAGSPGVTTTALGLALTWPRLCCSPTATATRPRRCRRATCAAWITAVVACPRPPASRGDGARPGVVAPDLPLVEQGDMQGAAAAPASRRPARLGSSNESGRASARRSGCWTTRAWTCSSTQGASRPAGSRNRPAEHGRRGAGVCPLDAALAGGGRIHLVSLEDQLRGLPTPRPCALAVIGPAAPIRRRRSRPSSGSPPGSSSRGTRGRVRAQRRRRRAEALPQRCLHGPLPLGGQRPGRPDHPLQIILCTRSRLPC